MPNLVSGCLCDAALLAAQGSLKRLGSLKILIRRLRDDAERVDLLAGKQVLQQGLHLALPRHAAHAVERAAHHQDGVMPAAFVAGVSDV